MPDALGATRTRHQTPDTSQCYWKTGHTPVGLMADNHAMIEATEFPVFDVQGYKATS